MTAAQAQAEAEAEAEAEAAVALVAALLEVALLSEGTGKVQGRYREGTGKVQVALLEVALLSDCPTRRGVGPAAAAAECTALLRRACALPKCLAMLPAALRPHAAPALRERLLGIVSRACSLGAASAGLAVLLNTSTLAGGTAPQGPEMASEKVGHAEARQAQYADGAAAGSVLLTRLVEKARVLWRGGAAVRRRTL